MIKMKFSDEDIRLAEKIAEHYRAIIELIGEDPEREGLAKTPMRAAKALIENMDSIQQYLNKHYPDAYVKLKRYNLTFNASPGNIGGETTVTINDVWLGKDISSQWPNATAP